MLYTIAPLLRYNMAFDDFGNLIKVSAMSWASAYYHVYGSYPYEYVRI